eukprot:9139159-Alexandrium_andersonii.AAC.1
MRVHGFAGGTVPGAPNLHSKKLNASRCAPNIPRTRIFPNVQSATRSRPISAAIPLNHRPADNPNMLQAFGA